ncbi:hypothetical protein ACJJTC_003871 [Scirpophaga incertulas]
MSHWNNSYVYNNQYQGTDSWNGELNAQYTNQSTYYPNQQYEQPASQQYVSFNEFISQMQNSNAVSNNSVNGGVSQYQNYDQYNYQNIPSSSHNAQLDNYSLNRSSNMVNEPETTYAQSNSNKAQQDKDPSLYANSVIFKSNLTATASEFVPKSSSAGASSSTQNNIYLEPNTNNETSSKKSADYKKIKGSSSDKNWRDRSQSSQQNNEILHKTETYSRVNDNNRQLESNSRNRDSKSRYQESSTYESNNRNNRNQTKQKGKNKDTDARTFYNSTIDKNGPDYRNGKGEGSGRNRNWAGSQRVRADRNNPEDEHYASNYLQYRDERADRSSRQENIATRNGTRRGQDNMYSPKARGRHTETVHTEMTQRERLSDQLDKGTLECLVCCERVKQIDQVWSCSNCYHVLHLRCIRKWALSSVVEGKWRCPACQNTSEEIPMEYRCMCGAVRSPEYQRGGSGAHTCGGACRRPRACPHPCPLPCHPGPCPPCQATITKNCGCGAETRSVLCSSKLPQLCGRVCHRELDCAVHVCQKECHEGSCESCTEIVTQVCYCPAEQKREVPCTKESGSETHWSCGEACSRVLACGHHVCRAACHPPPCAPCRLRPAAVTACPCGRTRIKEGSRKSCTDPIPLCGNICAKPLPCGPAGDRHFCKQSCHEGDCPVCPDKTVLQCRCGHSNREIPCADLPEMINNVFCQKKCNKKLSCGRHRCRTTCCAAPSHRCAVVCGRALSCQLHRCEEFCHSGHCAPCPQLAAPLRGVLPQRPLRAVPAARYAAGTQLVAGDGSHRCAVVCGRALSCQLHRCEEFCHSGHCAPCPQLGWEEVRCECGAQVALPPVRCGARPPPCTEPCRRPRSCGHPPHHSCHQGECPPCVVLTAKHCHGRHEERKTIPCSQEEFSCGLPCGKPLPCGKHTCIKTCHTGPCETGPCTQPCNEKRPSCGHPCAAPCHSAGEPACPSAAPCRRPVRACCPCGRRAAQRACCDNARDHARIMSALAATKMQESGSVDLSDVQRPVNVLKTLECDDECRVEARTRQMALALQIRNPDVSSKLAPRYSDSLRAAAAKDPGFAGMVHEKLTELVHRAKKSKQKTRSHSFPSMSWQKRQFIHELCEHFGCESMAYDAEPNRNVVATADRERSWLPAMSILEVISREAGKRKVPGPVLRQPPPATSSASTAKSGWATLTSTNAWAARSQVKQTASATVPTPAATSSSTATPTPGPSAPAADKIDYFDNPPDN